MKLIGDPTEFSNIESRRPLACYPRVFLPNCSHIGRSVVVKTFWKTISLQLRLRSQSLINGGFRELQGGRR